MPWRRTAEFSVGGRDGLWRADSRAHAPRRKCRGDSLVEQGGHQYPPRRRAATDGADRSEAGRAVGDPRRVWIDPHKDPRLPRHRASAEARGECGQVCLPPFARGRGREARRLPVPVGLHGKGSRECRRASRDGIGREQAARQSARHRAAFRGPHAGSAIRAEQRAVRVPRRDALGVPPGHFAPFSPRSIQRHVGRTRKAESWPQRQPRTHGRSHTTILLPL